MLRLWSSNYATILYYYYYIVSVPSVSSNGERLSGSLAPPPVSYTLSSLIVMPAARDTVHV